MLTLFARSNLGWMPRHHRGHHPTSQTHIIGESEPRWLLEIADTLGSGEYRLGMAEEQCTVILVNADGNETVASLGAGGTQVTGTRDHCRAFVDRHRVEHPQFESRNSVKFDIRCT